MKSLKNYLILIIFLFIQFNSYGQLVSKAKKDTVIQKFIEVNNKIYKFMQKAPAPIITYSTETDWVFGLAKFSAFRLSKKDTISQPSSISGTVGFSLNNQAFLGIGNKFYFNENKYITTIEFRLEKFPRQFFGVGNEINVTSAMVTASYAYLNFILKRKIFKNIFAGFNYNYSDYFNIDYQYDFLPVLNEAIGWNGGVASGFGITVEYDSRDNVYNAMKGYYLNFVSTHFSRNIGSDYDFNRYILDFRTYKTIFGNKVLAYQAYTQTNIGAIPFYLMSFMGGTERMRGYYEGQYRDKTIVDTQLEYRFPLFWLIGGVVYTSAGLIGPSYSELAFDDLKYTVGGGIRLMVDQKHKTNLRFDFGFGKNTVAMFFGFSEAF
ncbi:MAG: BamA/TamA family outer membrane protein [Bacteroidales bacterium]|nr:BamA/TamA family outer membrane protein [Bacteroidales bacterium]